MDFINLTPHDIILIYDDGSSITFLRSDSVARLNETVESERDYDFRGSPVPVVRRVFGVLSGLPERTYTEPTGYIVSSVVADAVANAAPGISIFVPGSLVRDEGGNITGCRNLILHRR